MKKLTVLSVVVASLLLVGCGDEPKEVAKEAVAPVAEKSVVEKAVDVAKETAKEATTATKEVASAVAEKSTEVAKDAEKAADAVAEKTAEVAKDAKDAVVEKATEVKDAVAKKATEAKDAVAEKTAEVVKDAKKAVTETVATVDVKACAGCHGANFEKKAMNVSKIVKNMNKADIVTALKGYKDGSYGGNMKALMKGQVASFDDAKIEAVATQIGK